MLKPVMICAALCGGLWLQMVHPAIAQNYGVMPGTSYVANPYARPAVSPYLNLGVNANGLSNYQTLVRPMIDDRDAVLQQSANLQQLQQQMRGGRTSQRSREMNQGDPAARSPKHFMHYSHYFEGIR